MGLVVNALSKMANSTVGTSFYKWSPGKKEEKLLCIGLPLVETAIATTSRVISTEKQKLSRREKNVLQAGHIVPAVVGITTGAFLNKKVFDLSESIGKCLDPNKVKDLDKVKGAIRVATPIFTTALLLRLILPTLTAFVTGEIEENKAKKKLDIKV